MEEGFFGEENRGLFFLELDSQALHNAAVFDMFLENLLDVLNGIWGVPDIVWIDYQGGAVGAGVKATRFVDAHFTFEPHFMDALFGMAQQIRRVF